MQNSVRAYCLAVLNDAACLFLCGELHFEILSIFKGALVWSNFAIFFCSILLVVVRSAQTAHVVYTSYAALSLVFRC